MTRFQFMTAAWLLATALPATADTIPATVPYRAHPDGFMAVQMLIGPLAKVGKDVSVNRIKFKAGKSSVEHIHADSDEILVITAGEMQFTLDGVITSVKAGDTVFIPRGHKHFGLAGNHPPEMIQIFTPAGPESRFKDFAYEPKAATK